MNKKGSRYKNIVSLVPIHERIRDNVYMGARGSTVHEMKFICINEDGTVQSLIQISLHFFYKYFIERND
jgi:hypothetical protein